MAKSPKRGTRAASPTPAKQAQKQQSSNKAKRSTKAPAPVLPFSAILAFVIIAISATSLFSTDMSPVNLKSIMASFTGSDKNIDNPLKAKESKSSKMNDEGGDDNLYSASDSLRILLFLNGENRAISTDDIPVSVPLRELNSASFKSVHVFDSVLSDHFISSDTLDSTFCDAGVDKTPKLYDHKLLVPVPSTGTLPCSFWTREGDRITNVEDLTRLEDYETGIWNGKQVYAVAAGRKFMYSAVRTGERFVLDHMNDVEGKTITLEVLSTEPKVR
jgi:hypothetical protein